MLTSQIIKVVHSNHDLLASLAIPGPKMLDGFRDARALFHFPKTTCWPPSHSVLGNADEKLGIICVLSRIFHRQDGGTCMLQDEGLKFLLVDGPAASAIMLCDFTTLTHESCERSPYPNIRKDSYIQITSLQCSECQCFLLSLELFCKHLEGHGATDSLLTMILKNMG